MDRKIIIAIVLTVTLVVAAGAYLVMREGEEPVGITAMEGVNKASEYINNTYGNGTLIHVQSMAFIEDGYSVGWSYNYLIFNNDTNEFQIIDVNVFNNGTITPFYYSGNGSSYGVIKDWSIDSNEAYQISMNIAEIQDFKLYIMVLTGGIDCPTWHIYYIHTEIMDNPRGADITINATSGEILNIEIHN